MHIYTHNHIHIYIYIIIYIYTYRYTHNVHGYTYVYIYIYIVCGSIIYNTIPYYMILYQIIIWLFQHIICIGTTNYVHSNQHMFICTYQYRYHTLYKYCISICIFVIPIHTSRIVYYMHYR